MDVRNPLLCLFALAMLLSISACQSHHPEPLVPGDQGATVVVGLIAKNPKVKSVINRNSLAQQMAQVIRDESRYQVPVVGLVSQQLGKEAYEHLVVHYSEHGYLSGADLEALRRADLGARYAIFARLEFDQVVEHDAENQQVYNNQGELLTDRMHVVSRTDRTTVISAMMVDVVRGASVWHNNFEVTLDSKNIQTLYSGSSFAGSLAATFTNTLANGIRGPRQPDAPSTAKAMRTLLKEVAKQM
ncbi:MAG: hypothetical protein KTR35_13695 [Gammaproteobacteria bacterium]|nr:hypothetical protein [Gammaproteobacteria bacterium]